MMGSRPAYRNRTCLSNVITVTTRLTIKFLLYLLMCANVCEVERLVGVTYSVLFCTKDLWVWTRYFGRIDRHVSPLLPAPDTRMLLCGKPHTLGLHPVCHFAGNLGMLAEHETLLLQTTKRHLLFLPLTAIQDSIGLGVNLVLGSSRNLSLLILLGGSRFGIGGVRLVGHRILPATRQTKL